MRKQKKWELHLVFWLGVLSLFIAKIIWGNVQPQNVEQRRESDLPTRNDNEKSTENTERIRVLIKTNGFLHIAHNKVEFQAKNGLHITVGKETFQVDPGKTITLKPDDEIFQKGKVTIQATKEGEKIKIKSLQRGYGTPVYRGKFQLYSTAEGIIIINELLLEEYLYGVVPSEMPASYHTEALKCQAVCARSYACCQMRKLAYPEYNAHVDDSTSYQVYGNSKEQNTTTKAVKETEGLTVQYKGETVITYYFSTSAGKTTDIKAWGTKQSKKNRYLQGASVCDESGSDYEKDYPWYRWRVCISKEHMRDLLELNTKVELGELEELAITKRGAGNVALQLKVIGSKGNAVIETENKIRRVLGNGNYVIEKQDGSTCNATELLPSAFINISLENDVYYIDGGGFGHGIGMSQNGANEMAKSGKNYIEILSFFYTRCNVE